MPGVVANPNGRQVGSRNRRTEELFIRLESRGDLDPADYLSSVVNDKTKPDDLRATAANMLLPYKYSKAGTAPVKIFIEHTIVLPHHEPRTLSDVRENIHYLSNLKLSQQIDTTTGNNLILDQTKLHDSILEETKLLSALARTS
jgi:hypothetical protein